MKIPYLMMNQNPTLVGVRTSSDLVCLSQISNYNEEVYYEITKLTSNQSK